MFFLIFTSFVLVVHEDSCAYVLIVCSALLAYYFLYLVEKVFGLLFVVIFIFLHTAACFLPVTRSVVVHKNEGLLLPFMR